MLTTRPDKAAQRDDLESQMAKFLAKGGQVESVNSGQSGDSSSNPWITPLQFSGAKTNHTPITNVLKTIDSRKQARLKSKPQAKPKPIHSRQTKEWIYDDFGEPIRWVWKK